MKKATRFRKGQLAIGTCNIVLVTGSGDKSLEYPTFSGVVVMAQHPDFGNDAWPVGMYSDSWTTGAFVHTDLKMNHIMRKVINKNKQQ